VRHPALLLGSTRRVAKMVAELESKQAEAQPVIPDFGKSQARLGDTAVDEIVVATAQAVAADCEAKVTALEYGALVGSCDAHGATADFEERQPPGDHCAGPWAVRSLRFEAEEEEEGERQKQYHVDLAGDIWHGWVEYEVQEQGGFELDEQYGDDSAEASGACSSGTTGGSEDSLEKQLEAAKDKLQKLKALASAGPLGQVAARVPRQSQQIDGCDAMMQAAYGILAEAKLAQQTWS